MAGATHLLSTFYLIPRAFARGYKQRRAYSTSIFASENSEKYLFSLSLSRTHFIEARAANEKR